MTVGSSAVSATEMVARWPESPDPSEVTASLEAPTETWGEKLYAALPLFIVGGACLAVAIDFYDSGASTPFMGNSAVRLAPWALFLALAVTGLSAGIFALLVEDEEPVPPEPVTVSAPPAPAPPWDESTIAPAQPTLVRPRTWERHPLEPGEMVGWTPAEPTVERVPPDVVLVQIDEIAASLRKKPPSAPPS